MPGCPPGFRFTPGLSIRCITPGCVSHAGTGNNSTGINSSPGYKPVTSPYHTSPCAAANRDRDANPDAQLITQTDHTATTKARSHYMGQPDTYQPYDELLCW